MALRLNKLAKLSLAGLVRGGRVSRLMRVPQLRPYSMSLPRFQQQQQQQHQHQEQQQQQGEEQQQAGGTPPKKPWTPRDYARLVAWLTVLGGIPAYVIYKGGDYWIEIAEEFDDDVQALDEADRERRPPPQSGLALIITDWIKRPFRWVVLNYVKEDQDDLMAPQIPDGQGRTPRTIVLNFEGTIAHPFWSRSENWRIRKRPGLKEFMDRVRQANYEVVIWSTKSQVETEHNVSALELPVQGMFFREAAKGRLFSVSKDLTRLGRDIKRVIMVDLKDNIVKQKENTVVVSKFTENKEDKEMLRLADFCENIAKYNIRDVRPYVAEYNKGLDVKEIFKKEKELSSQARQALAGGRGALMSKVGALRNKQGSSASSGARPAAA